MHIVKCDAYTDAHKRCAWEWEMQDSHPSRGIPMGMGTKLLKLMGIGWEYK